MLETIGVSFVILVQGLARIRWLPSQVRLRPLAETGAALLGGQVGASPAQSRPVQG